MLVNAKMRYANNEISSPDQKTAGELWAILIQSYYS